MSELELTLLVLLGLVVMVVLWWRTDEMRERAAVADLAAYLRGLSLNRVHLDAARAADQASGESLRAAKTALQTLADAYAEHDQEEIPPAARAAIRTLERLTGEAVDRAGAEPDSWLDREFEEIERTARKLRGDAIAENRRRLLDLPREE